MPKKRALSAVLVTVLALLVFYLSSPSSRSLNATLVGDYYLLRGQPVKAENAYAQAAKLAPQEWRPQNRLARTYDQQSRYEKGWGHHESALRLGPREPEVLLCAASSLLTQNRFAEARRLLIRLLAEDPSNFEGLFLMSKVAMGLKDNRTTIFCLRKVLEHNPHHHVAHGQLALLLSESRPDIAVREGILCLEAGPPPGWEESILLILARSYIKLGQPQQARQAALRLVQMYPKSQQAGQAAEILRQL